MHRTTLLTATITGLLTIAPVLQTPARAAPTPTREGVARLPIGAGSIRDLQAKLSERGFSPGQVDGLWGPDTAGALSRFQAARGLRASGRFDPATLAALGPIGAGPLPPVAHPLDATTASGVPVLTPAAPAPTADPGPVVDQRPAVKAAGARGAMAAASDNALQPAHGANSFSKAEAGHRIAGHDFQAVGSLHKDAMGVWRGDATKDGQRVQVWLDYKGNVGQQ